MVNWNAAASDPVLALYMANILDWIQDQDNFAAISGQVEIDLGQPALSQYYPIDDIMPAYAVYTGPGVTIVAALGLKTAVQVGVAVLGWIEGRRTRTNNGFSRTADAVSAIMYRALVAQNALDNQRYIFAGHSYGGMCLHSLATRLASEVPTRIVSLLTFGSPKPGDDRIANAMRQVDICRWMNDGDLVTFGPPTGDEAPIMHLLLSRGESEAVNQLVQLNIGKVLSTTGGITDAGYPPNDSFFTDLSIANFLFRNEAPVAQAHRLPEYVRRLSAWVADNPAQAIRQRAAGNDIGVLAPIPPAPIPPAGLLRRRELGDGANGGDVAIGDIISAQLPSPPAAAPKPYVAKKMGNLWVVYYVTPDRTVYIGKGKRDAKSFASDMNKALRRWDNAPATDEAGFESSVIDAFN